MTNQNIEYPIQGSCQCGQVTYRLFKPPRMVAACHCKECQKLSTSAFSITAVVDSDSIEFNGEMKEWFRIAESGNKNIAKFCPGCGNRIYHFNPHQQEEIKLKLKPDNHAHLEIFEPTVHVWVSEKQDWYQIPGGVAQFDKQAGR